MKIELKETTNCLGETKYLLCEDGFCLMVYYQKEVAEAAFEKSKENVRNGLTQTKVINSFELS